jgi:flavin reductase (DIM6/NTAB) family NADH-FMN oxidoreductase RutF
VVRQKRWKTYVSTTQTIPSEVAEDLKGAMRFMPSPLAIVSALAPDNREPVGMAVTAYVPISMDPPSMQICINRSASGHDPILEAGTFCINILGLGSDDILQTFADPARRADRFRQGAWVTRNGAPLLLDARAALICKTAMTHRFGTHSLVIGEVAEVLSNPASPPAVWLEGKMRAVS